MNNFFIGEIGFAHEVGARNLILESFSEFDDLYQRSPKGFWLIATNKPFIDQPSQYYPAIIISTKDQDEVKFFSKVEFLKVIYK